MTPTEGSGVVGLPGFTHHYAEANDTRLHFVSGGAGDPVLLLHGWPFTWLEWRRLMPLLAKNYTVVAPDLRGMGDSDKPASGYAKSNVAEDVRQLVEQLGHPSINVVGTDIGTMVAYALAVASPELVRTLVLSESVLPGFGLEELMNPATGGYPHFGLHMQVDLATMLTSGKEEAYLRPMWSQMSVVDSDLADNLLPYFVGDGGMRGGFEHYGTLLDDGRYNRARHTEKLGMPVLVLNGSHGIPQDQTLSSVAQVAADFRSDIVPDSGHTIGEDNPEWLGLRLHRFFTSAHQRREKTSTR